MLSHKAFAQGFNLLASAAKVKQFPREQAGEIAFAGRSNCGKSSLINALLGTKSCSRTSKNPGRTQTINFFAIGRGLEQRVLVDFPGYGYARAPHPLVHAWQSLVLRYCHERKTLMVLCLVIDARRGLTPQDRGFVKKIGQLRCHLLAVITKIDCLSLSQRVGLATQIHTDIAKIASTKTTSYVETSARKRWGIIETRNALMTLSATKISTKTAIKNTTKKSFALQNSSL